MYDEILKKLIKNYFLDRERSIGRSLAVNNLSIYRLASTKKFLKVAK